MRMTREREREKKYSEISRTRKKYKKYALRVEIRELH